MKKRNFFGAVAIGLAIVVLGVVILCLFLGGEYKKTAHGKEVQCTINSVSGDYILCSYYDENGDIIRAEAVNASPSSTYVGKVCKGYVMPNATAAVYLKSSALLYIGLIALSLFLIIGGGLLIIHVVIQNADWRLISKEGTFTTGEIVNIRYENAGKNVYYVANIRYVDENGEEHFFEDYSDKNDRRPGKQYTIGYARKKNGKYTAKIM